VRDGDQSSACGYPVFPTAFIEEAVFSPLCVLGSFVKNPLTIDVYFCVWIFYSNPLLFLSVFVPTPCCFYCYDSVVYLKSATVMPPALDISLRIALAIQSLL
jgi:hypothetical protein